MYVLRENICTDSTTANIKGREKYFRSQKKKGETPILGVREIFPMEWTFFWTWKMGGILKGKVHMDGGMALGCSVSTNVWNSKSHVCQGRLYAS